MYDSLFIVQGIYNENIPYDKKNRPNIKIYLCHQNPEYKPGCGDWICKKKYLFPNEIVNYPFFPFDLDFHYGELTVLNSVHYFSNNSEDDYYNALTQVENNFHRRWHWYWEFRERELILTREQNQSKFKSVSKMRGMYDISFFKPIK